MQKLPKSGKTNQNSLSEENIHSDNPKETPSSLKTNKNSPSGLSKTGNRNPKTKKNILVVGIGASAGGLEAIEGLFSGINAVSMFAFVIIVHLATEHKSIMNELLKKFTNMKIFVIEDGMEVHPDCIYITPPNQEIGIMNNKLYFLEPTKLHSQRRPIDFFFKSLAKDRGSESIGIILSGTGSDGTEGFQEIKEHGGVTIVQSPETAKYEGMPRSAINAGIVDYILSTGEISEFLMSFQKDELNLKSTTTLEKNLELSDDLFRKILFLIRNHTGQDLTFYKTSTLQRRIEKRMGMHQIRNIKDYVDFLYQNEEEIGLLFSDMLIGVSSFFRDNEAFESLKNKVLPEIFSAKSAHDPIRIWVNGCSTGEEAYSITILFKEYMTEQKITNHIQIFATDIDQESIEIARKGIYPENISENVSEERLNNFFTKVDNSYKINKEIRESILFSKQNVLFDPPFSKIDLICCRNLLIYLNPRAQQKIFSLFLYALNKSGFLFLGKSESIGKFSEMFSVIDAKWKIFKANDTFFDYETKLPFKITRMVNLPVSQKIESKSVDIGDETRKILLEKFTPPCVIVNEKHDIVYIQGRTGKFLEPVSGKFQNDILQMAREGLQIPLSIALRKVLEEKHGLILDKLEIKENGGFNLVDVYLEPLVQPEALAGLVMVVFDLIKPIKSEPEDGSESKKNLKKLEHVKYLESELNSTKEYLKGIVEQMGTSNEELISMNEELQSSNEELQTTNEELETSKEELESLNEELMTVNSELESKIEELSNVNNDINNLLVNINIAIIFLDTKLNVKRFTSAATGFISLQNSDIGRPISDLTSKIKHSELTEGTLYVLRTMKTYRDETQTDDGRWVDMRITPYLTVENIIDGVIVTFSEITELKNKERDLNKIHLYLNNVLATVSESFIIIDENLKVLMANERFLSLFGLTKRLAESELVYKLGDEQLNISELRKLIHEIVLKNTVIKDYEIIDSFPGIGKRKMLVNARQVFVEDNNKPLIFLSLTDITGLLEKQ